MIHLGANSVLFAGFDLENGDAPYPSGRIRRRRAGRRSGACASTWSWTTGRRRLIKSKSWRKKYELKLLAMEEAALDEERLMLAFCGWC